MSRSRTTRALLVGVTGTAVTLALTIPAPSALARPAKDPSGTQLVSGASSVYPDVPNLNAYTPSGIVYTDSRGVWLIATSGGAPASIAPVGSVVTAAAGKMVWIQPRVGAKYWYDVTSGNTGNIPGGWKAPSTTGGLYEQLTPDGTLHVMNQNVSTGRLTDLGALPSWASSADVLTPGTTGVLVVGRTRGGSVAMQFLGYSDPATMTPSLTGIAASDTIVCTSVTAAAAGCADTTTNSAIAISLTGLGPVIEPTNQPISSGPVVTGSALVWSGHTSGDDLLHSVPLGGGSESIMSSPRIGAGDGIVTDATNVYIPTSGNGDTGFIGSVADATGTPSTVRLDPPLALTVGNLNLAPGRVAWEDDATRAKPLWSRTAAPDGAGGVALGATQNVVNNVQNTSLYASGIRTAYVDSHGYPTVTNGTTTIAPRSTGQVTALSGTRMVYQHTPTSHPMLDDLAAGGTSDLSSYGMSLHVPVALWGNYIGYVDNDGSVWRADLTNSNSVIRVAPPQPAGRSVVYGSVWLSGNLMAWSVVTTDGTQYYTSNQYADLSSGNGPTNAPSGASIVGASSTGIMLFTSGVTTLQSWDGTSTMTIPGTAAVAEGDLVAWVGSDGDPRIAPVTFPVSDQPWALGNWITTTTLSTNGTWSLDVPTSATLTRCTVSFSDVDGNVVDTIPCDSAAAAQGEAMATWTPPANVPFGRYTWQLNAGNSDGTLLAADGSNSAISGSITVGVTLNGQVNPNSLARGTTQVNIVVHGTRFDSSATVKFGTGVRVWSVVVNSSTTLTALVDVQSTTTTGTRNVVVSDPGSADATCKACFTVT